MTDEPPSATGRRDEIEDLLRRPVLMDSGDRIAYANVLAMLEIADAIDRLAGEIEKAGRTKK